MEAWILPITLLPGIGLLIISTSNLVVSLSDEIDHLEHQHQELRLIIESKIHQLDILNKALVGFYVSAGIFTFSGIIMAFYEELKFSRLLMGVGVIVVFISLILLIIYSFRSVRIRKTQFNQNINTQ